jgi:Fe-S oxidoreductase
VYEVLADNPPPMTGRCAEDVVIHDPCTTRGFPRIHDAVRTLVALTGARIKEMPHNRETTLCCGEGGAAAFIAPELTGKWKKTRHAEAGGSRIITYCAGCSSTFDTSLWTTHLLDLLFDHDRALTGDEQKTRPPFTYLNRLRLKWRMKSR